MSFLLELRGISKSFGGLQALNEVSFTLNSGEIVGIIGPNGAGKTTLFNIIGGVLLPTNGQITLEDRNIAGLKPHEIARKGIVQTFQLTVLFMELTVLQNALIGIHMHSRISPFRICFSRSPIPESEMEKAMEILEIVGLTRFKDRLAGELPHGRQRMLGIGIALGCTPRILLLDEPVTGMNTDEKKAIIDLVRDLNQKGITILLVEHDIRTVMDICQRILVLNFGKKISEGLPSEIRSNKDVIEAYLGTECA